MSKNKFPLLIVSVIVSFIIISLYILDIYKELYFNTIWMKVVSCIFIIESLVFLGRNYKKCYKNIEVKRLIFLSKVLVSMSLLIQLFVSIWYSVYIVQIIHLINKYR